MYLLTASLFLERSSGFIPLSSWSMGTKNEIKLTVIAMGRGTLRGRERAGDETTSPFNFPGNSSAYLIAMSPPRLWPKSTGFSDSST